MKRKILNVLVIVLTISVICELYIYLNNVNNSQILESVKVNDTFKDKKGMVSIQIQNDNDYDFHEATDRSKWPDKNVYTFGGAECTDGEGAEINYRDVLTFDEVTYEAHIKTENTAYCTLFFSKGKPAFDYLKLKGGNKFYAGTADFGLFRFKGTKDDVTNHDLNNYICFGTTDIATCTGTDKQYYMYRIIGITDNTETNTALELEANQLKIIRAYPSSTSQQWHDNNAANARWDGSEHIALVQIYLNGDFLITDKTKWKNTYWEKLIDEPYWYIGDNTNWNSTTENTVSNEKHKIGLIYKSDYVISNSQTKNNWLFIANGMSNNPQMEEWTMSRNSSGTAWYIYIDATLKNSPYYVHNTYAVRPVFYLKPNVTLVGEGTEASPFIITNKS